MRKMATMTAKMPPPRVLKYICRPAAFLLSKKVLLFGFSIGACDACVGIGESVRVLDELREFMKNQAVPRGASGRKGRWVKIGDMTFWW
jgi:hypothetical protein